MADFWVRKNGGADKPNAITLATAMSVAAFNAATFDGGDRICFSGIDGDLTTAVIPPYGGITLVADPERGCNVHGGDTLESCIDIVSKDSVVVDGIDVTHPLVDGVQVRGTSSGVIIRNIDSSYSGNQAFQMENTASAVFEDVVGRYCTDDGFSLHDDAIANVLRGHFHHNSQGINLVSGTTGTFTDSLIEANTAESVYCSGDARTPRLTLIGCSVLGGIYSVYGTTNADIKLINSLIDAQAAANHAVDMQTATRLLVFGTIFSGQAAAKYGVVVRAGCTCDGIFNSLFLPGVGRGISASDNIKITNTIIAGLNTGIFRGAGTVNLKNSCLFGNTTGVSGTVTQTNVITSDPLLSSYRLGEKSPCIGRGLSVAGITDTYADRYGSTRHLNPNIGQDQSTGWGFGPWMPFDGTMPALSLSDTAPATLLEVEVK